MASGGVKIKTFGVAATDLSQAQACGKHQTLSMRDTDAPQRYVAAWVAQLHRTRHAPPYHVVHANPAQIPGNLCHTAPRKYRRHTSAQCTHTHITPQRNTHNDQTKPDKH